MRRAEHRKLGLTIDYDRFSVRSSASRENSEGVSLNTQSFEISEVLGQHPKFILFAVRSVRCVSATRRGVCSSDYFFKCLGPLKR